MDRLVKRFDCTRDNDLMLCEHKGIAYAADMRVTAKYDGAYFEKVAGYRDTQVAKEVRASRVAMMREECATDSRVIDWGTGDCAMIDALLSDGWTDVRGYDVMPQTRLLLESLERYTEDIESAQVLTLWDVLEHMPDPHDVLERIARDAYVFVSIPAFNSLRDIRQSKHYRPGEHHYYWTIDGFVQYMRMYGYRLLEASDAEQRAGREDIWQFSFVRNLPGLREIVEQYEQLHLNKYYGSSAVELHFDAALTVVQSVKPRSILDFGCGRSEMGAWFWCDGERTIRRYDPAIRTYRHLPNIVHDLVFCFDVMEHVPISAVDDVLRKVAKSGRHALFTISTKLARQKLPNGDNAHITLLSAAEWKRWVGEYFRTVRQLPTAWEHELMLLCHH